MGPEFPALISDIKVVTADWPVIVVDTSDNLTDGELIDFLEKYDAFMQEQNQRHAVVVDLKRTKRMPSRQRKMITDSMSKRNEYTKQFSACTALVFESAVMRGMLMAIFWIVKPAYPTKVFNSRKEAVAWCQTML